MYRRRITILRILYSIIQVLAIKCYNGSPDAYELVECSSTPIDRYGLLDRCLTISTGIDSYACTSKNQAEARGLRDNQCTTIRGVEWCVCVTDGCNFPNRSPLQGFPSSANPPLTPSPTLIQITPMVAIALLLMCVFLLLLVLMLVFKKLLCKGKE